MNKFDQKDFTNNPLKYELFKTARIASHIFTHNGEHDLVEGTPVAIQYLRTDFNSVYRQDMPIYYVSTSNHFHGCMYATTLADFVL